MKTDIDTGNELRIFVYGTLKKGFSNHESYCEGVSRIIPARIRGRLFKLTPNIPVMIVPACDILALGSADLAADIRLPAGFCPDVSEGCGARPGAGHHVGKGSAIATRAAGAARSAGSGIDESAPRGEGNCRVNKVEKPGLLGPAGEWKTISGELLFFDDPETRLLLIDELEEFRPEERSTYLRVLVRVVLADGSPTSAWTYIAGFDTEGLEHYDGESWFPDE